MAPTFACRRFTDDTQTRWSSRNICGANCVAIHLRAIERWQVRVSNDDFGKDSLWTIAERNRFDFQLRRMLKNNLDCFCDRNHRDESKSKSGCASIEEQPPGCKRLVETRKAK